MSHTALHHLLDRNLLLPAEYGNGLSNHLPMALHALDRMGADTARLQQFFDTYAARFAPQAAPASDAPVLADWLPHRGRYASLPALQATILQALQRDDAATVLHRVVPHLISGVGAAAFHGLLRTAHAFEAGHIGELAHGLAYWAARWLELPAVSPAAASLPFDAWAAELARQSAGWKSNAPLISPRMQAAAQSAPYGALSGALAIDPDTMDPLCDFAAAAYADSGNFTVLHLVTGSRAAGVLLPFAGEAAPAMAALVRAVTAAYLASGVASAAQRRRPVPERAVPGWVALATDAIRSDDEHVIKLVDACLMLAAARGGLDGELGSSPYRRAALRVFG